MCIYKWPGIYFSGRSLKCDFRCKQLGGKKPLNAQQVRLKDIYWSEGRFQALDLSWVGTRKPKQEIKHLQAQLKQMIDFACQIAFFKYLQNKQNNADIWLNSTQMDERTE